jgi:hypothetical protein
VPAAPTAPTTPRVRPAVADAGTLGKYRELCRDSVAPTSWLRPDVLLRSRNDLVARLHDPVAQLREEWLAVQQVPAGDGRAEALRITGHEKRDHASLMVLGDSGEGDGSQMAVVPGLLKAARGADFTVVCSDVIYPAGEARDYLPKFYCPYRELPGPIYAIPGNHDWYDRLVGFMTHFCDAPRLPPGNVQLDAGLRGFLTSLLWRHEGLPEPGAMLDAKQRRQLDPAFPPQRGPYWTLDAGPVRLVGIDTGITGGLDYAQGDWLLRVSRERGAPKILLTGKPPIVDARYQPSPLAGHRDGKRELTVDDVVRDPDHGYVAVIGGDIHNYQRYPVTLSDGRRIEYIVAGGSGAFMHSTHRIPRVDDPEHGLAAQIRHATDEGVTVTEADSHLFPARAWSLYWFTKRLGGRLPPALRGLSYIEAAAMIGDALEIEPLDPEARRLLESYRRGGMPARVRAAQTLFYKRLPAPGKLFQRFVSEFLDWNDPPMAKSFLRVDAEEGAIRVRCFQATGWLKDEVHPPVEDDVTIALD